MGMVGVIGFIFQFHIGVLGDNARLRRNVALRSDGEDGDVPVGRAINDVATLVILMFMGEDVVLAGKMRASRQAEDRGADMVAKNGLPFSRARKRIAMAVAEAIFRIRDGG